MRILMIPRIDTVDGTCSLSRLPLGFVREALKAHKDSYFYLVVHESFANCNRWLLNYGVEEEDLCRVELISISDEDVGSPTLITYQRRLEYSVGPALRNKIRPFDKVGKYADVVLTECFQSNHYIRSVMNGFWFRSYTTNIPIISWSHWSPTSDWQKLGRSGLLNKTDWQASVTGLVGSDGVVFGSFAQRDQTLSDLEEWFNNKQIKKLREDWPIIESGVNVSNVPFREESNGPLSGVWTGYTTQDFEPCAPGLVRAGLMKKFGRVVLQFMGDKIGTERAPEVEQYSSLDYVEIQGILKHPEFLEMLASCDCIASTVPGSWGIRVAEAMATGCIPFLTRFTADNMRLPKDYPFIISSSPDAYEKISAYGSYLANVKVRNEWRSRVRKHAIDNFNVVIQSEKVYQYVHKIFTRCNKETNTGDMGNKVKSIVECSDAISHDEVVDAIGGGLFSSKSASMFSHRFLKLCIQNAGFFDSGSECPIYRRVRD